MEEKKSDIQELYSDAEVRALGAKLMQFFSDNQIPMGLCFAACESVLEYAREKYGYRSEIMHCPEHDGVTH